jgi:predicted flap endonuclease-1-like 5' DNA nuclease
MLARRMSDQDPDGEAPTEADAPPTERPPPDPAFRADFVPPMPNAVRRGPPPLQPRTPAPPAVNRAPGQRPSAPPPPVRPIGVPRPPPPRADGVRPKLPPPPPPTRPAGNAVQNASTAALAAGALDRARTAIARAEQEISRLHVRLEAIEAVEAERTQLRSHASALEARIAALEIGAPLDSPGAIELRSRLDRVDSRIELLDQRFGEIDGRESTPPPGDEFDPLEGRVEALEAHAVAAARVAALEARLDALEAHGSRDAFDARIEIAVSELREWFEARLEAMNARIAAVEAREQTGAPSAEPADLAGMRERLEALERGGAADTGGLRRIKGIGPKYERLLREAGVHDVADIARWTDADIERFAAVLGIAANRIRNAGWVEIAQGLVEPR